LIIALTTFGEARKYRRKQNLLGDEPVLWARRCASAFSKRANLSKEVVMPRERRKESLRLAVVTVLCAGAASAGAQTYVGNNFASGSSLLGALQTDGNSDQYPPLVILQEYSLSISTEI
jgi:hypothetical protein